MKQTSFVISFASLVATGSAMPGLVDRQATGFNPSTQAVSVTGSNAWQAPGSSDMRGPCPGLNAMANHGYIPRNGFVSIEQVVQGMYDTYGMGADFGTAIAVAAAVEAGDGTSFSIGGPPPANLVAGGLLGQPLGISNSHNRFEGDASITRNDLYISGNAYTLQLPFFKALLDYAGTSDNFDLGLLGDYSTVRYNYSLYNNPYFFRGPVGAAVPPGTNGLAAHLFSNKSAQYPNGYLSRATLKSFFGVTGADDALQFTPGQERIPANWYKWAPSAPYTTASFAADVAAVYEAHPNDLVVGGNTGTPNSMTGVNVADLTGGAYNTASLLKGNNLACFMFQVLAFETPDLITSGGVINDALGTINGKMQTAVSNAISGLSCPNLAQYNDSQLNIFPGYTKYSDKTGKY